jgi:hypothetical protein
VIGYIALGLVIAILLMIVVAIGSAGSDGIDPRDTYWSE